MDLVAQNCASWGLCAYGPPLCLDSIDNSVDFLRELDAFLGEAPLHQELIKKISKTKK